MARAKKQEGEKRGKGHPRAFKDADEYMDKFIKYIQYCRDNKRFANIAGFCAYYRITRETFYVQKEYYSDAYTIVNDILEDEVLQDNTYRAQLYLKNKFGYKDRQEIDQKTEHSGEITITLENELKDWSK